MNKNSTTNSELDTFVKNVLVESYAKIFRVNVNTGEYEVYKNDGLRDDDGVLEDCPSIYDYVQRLITDKAIYPEYATACRRLANPEYVRKSVFSGEKRIVQSYRRRTVNGDRWITFAIISNGDCSPENPMVLFTWREADSDTITLLDTLPTISSLYDKLIRINLSNNTYEPVIVDSDEQERLSGGVINMYEWWAGYSQNGNIASEDMGAFSTLTKTGSLQKRFAEDPSPISFNYRRKINGEFRWVQLSISPSVEYSEDNQIMLLTLKDIHEEYTAQERRHQELLDNMHRDALTNLYNRLKFNADIDSVEKDSRSTLTCLYIDVNGLHELNNLLGHQKGDDMLCCVADTLRKYFPDERAYRIGGDEYVVTSFKLSAHAVELIVEEVRRDLLRDNYEISVGIASGTCDQDAEKIVAAAESKMREDKANYYMQKGDRRRNRQMNEELEQMLVEKHDSERFLNIISHQFLGVFFVDLVGDTARHIYTTDLFTDLLEETDDSFSEALRLYVERFVKSEHDNRFDDILDFDKLEQKLGENGSLRIAYQKIDGVHMSIRILKADNRKDGKTETVWIFAEENQS